MSDVHLFALDGGGSSCRALLCHADGREVVRVTGAFANLTSDFEASYRHIQDVIETAYDRAGIPFEAHAHDIAVLGVAGAEFGDAADRLKERLGFASATVLSDRETTITGVLGEGDGTLAQIGTGSFFVSRTDGARAQAGGWGLAIGDECSGAWLGRELLRMVVRAYDGLDAGSDLVRETLAAHGDDPRALAIFASTATPRDLAALAPAIFDAAMTGDIVAQTIVRRAVIDLETILGGIVGTKDLPLYLCGGVGARYGPLLAPSWQRCLATAPGDGLSGALAMAREIAAGS